MVTELGPPVSESSTRISKFYASTNSKLKLTNWLTTTLCSAANGETPKVLYTHPESLGITLETFHFFKNVQVFLNTTPITQSSIQKVLE